MEGKGSFVPCPGFSLQASTKRAKNMGRLHSFSVVLALAAVLGSGTTASAGGFFRDHCCESDCCTHETVKLPAQKVIVENPRPRVLIEEAAPVERVERVVRRSLTAAPAMTTMAVPMVATIFTPMAALPVTTGTREVEVREAPVRDVVRE